MPEKREIPFGRPWIGAEERAAVLEVLDGPILTHGPQTSLFEQEFAAFVGSSEGAVATSSCMGALHMAYLTCGVGPGDEVLVPAQTHVATAHAVEWTGATPVFVDCDPATGNVTADGLARAITPRTRALAVVHFVGIPCDMPAIAELVRAKSLKVVEDCAIALGAKFDGTHVGLFGDAGCFSFYPVKHMTTAEGGMLISRHADVLDRVRKLRAFGVDRIHQERKVPGMYDVPTLGLNYRMSEIQAAIGRAQLHRMPEALATRRRHFLALQQALSAVPGARVLDAAREEAINSHYCLSLVFEGKRAASRDQAVAQLNAAGIGTSIYYPQPVPRMTYYRNKYGYDAARYLEAAAISDASVALPVGPHLSDEDVSYIAQVVTEEYRAWV